MSVNNAPGEVDNKDIFDSPNISTSEDTAKEEVDKEAEERKKRETVDIDGVPIDEKDIKYKAADIRKKKKMKYFVNITDKDKYEKAEAKRKAEVQHYADKIAAEAKREEEREKKEAADAAAKKQAEENQHIEDVKNYIKDRKKAEANKKKQAEHENRPNRVKAIFFDGWHKFATAGILVVIVIAIVSAIAIQNIVKPGTSGGEEEPTLASEDSETTDEQYKKALEKMNSTPITNALSNYEFDDAERFFNNIADGVDDKKYKALVYLRGANKILSSSEDEVARAERMIDKAYIYGSEDITTLETIINMYNMIGNNQKMEEAQRKLSQLYAAVPYDDNLTEEDWYGEG